MNPERLERVGAALLLAEHAAYQRDSALAMYRVPLLASRLTIPPATR
jgi:hypothetical protein